MNDSPPPPADGQPSAPPRTSVRGRPLGTLPDERPEALVTGIIIILGLWIVGAAFAWHSHGVESDRARQAGERQATALATSLRGMVLGTDLAMQWVMEGFAVEADRFRFERYRASDLLRTATVGLPFIERLMVTDAAGILLHDSASPGLRGTHPLPPAMVGTLARLIDQDIRPVPPVSRQAPTPGALPLVAAAGADPAGPDPMARDRLYLGTRMTDTTGQPVGFLVAQARQSFLIDLFRTGEVGDSGSAALYGVAERLLLSGRPSPILTVTPPPAVEALFSGGNGTASHATLEDPRSGTLVSLARVEGYPLVVAVAVPWNEAMGRWREDTQAYALLGLLLTGLVLVASAALQRSIRARQEQAAVLAARERELASLFANAGAGIILMNHAGDIRNANQAYCRLVGRDMEALRGRSVYSLSPAQDHAAMRDAMRRVERGETSVGYEKRYLHPDGHTVWVAVSLSAQRPPTVGDPPDAVAVVVDVTERHRVEARLAAQAQELARSNVELEQFAYVASHDLQEPLRTIVSYLQLLDRRLGPSLDGDCREFLTYAVGGARHMSRLIQDLLEYSRVGRDARPLEMVALRPLVMQVIALLNHGETAEVAPDITLFTQDIHVPGNPSELFRLFQNLLGNAVKYRSPDRPLTITLSAQIQGEDVQISVRDNGIGFAPQFADRVFKLFQRLHTTGYDGTGIGLAVCRKIVQHHGGRIWCDAQEGRGAAFHFTLPLTAPRQSAPPPVAMPPVAMPEA